MPGFRTDWEVDARAVDVARRLQDEAPDGAAFAGAPGKQVEGADHVHLMGAARIHVEGVDAGEGVDDGVDADRAHELADEGVTDVELEVVGATEVVVRLADVDADDLRDVRVLDQALHDKGAPPARDAGDEDAALFGSHS